jgi:hypothetical protein
MYEWTDPDEGTVWQMYYDVPQGGDRRECVMYRVKGMNEWQELPPFAFPPKEAMNEWFGEVIPASIMSDIERIDSAIKKLGEICDEGEDENAWKKFEFVFDALGDARSGLLYAGDLNETPYDPDPLLIKDWNDLAGAFYRLTADLKRLESIPADMKFNID